MFAAYPCFKHSVGFRSLNQFKVPINQWSEVNKKAYLFLTSRRRSKFRELQYAFLNGPKQFLSRLCKKKGDINHGTALRLFLMTPHFSGLPLNVAKDEHTFCIYTANLHGQAASADLSVLSMCLSIQNYHH